MVKMITYDLCNPDKNYDELTAEIKNLSNATRVMDSVWLTNSKIKCIEIRNKLKELMDKDDRLFVSVLTGECAWNGQMLSASEDIKTVLNK